MRHWRSALQRSNRRVRDEKSDTDRKQSRLGVRIAPTQISLFAGKFIWDRGEAGLAEGLSIYPFRKPAARPPSVMDKVLEILTHYGYAKPQPDSLLTKWFERVAREDEAAAVPGPGRLAFMAATFNEKFGVGMTKSKMLGGHFPTPQAIADLA